jgi:hypothetical protein
MNVVVSLKDVVEAMDLPNSEWTSYLNPKTREIVAVTDQDRQLIEDEDLDEGDLPEWQRERLPNMRAALESSDFLVLPNKSEIHEWAITERFSNGQARAARRDELLDAIHGAGAFRSFRSAIRPLAIEDDCFRFRQTAFRGASRGYRDVLPAADRVGDHSAADRPAGVEAVEHVAAPRIERDKVSSEFAVSQPCAFADGSSLIVPPM